ncbi:MAG TPA: cob(I)yrinic acid a,c-diamide adenosyltransferase [Bacteroidota bacterium]|nr:cob(I)yrinic acid a,c-diamide adenosyltransferase [Bacteroidota bacterium]
MKIYTKTGDKGETGLFGGDRVSKDSLRIEAYGAVDELNSLLGVVRSFRPGRKVDEILERIQNELFVLGADLATKKRNKRSLIPHITGSQVLLLERTIDAIQRSLPPLKAFVLPGGTPGASYLHYARTVCRRAERSAVRLMRLESINKDILVYLNRLSDLLFVLSRRQNLDAKKQEIQWKNPSPRR